MPFIWDRFGSRFGIAGNLHNRAYAEHPSAASLNRYGWSRRDDRQYLSRRSRCIDNGPRVLGISGQNGKGEAGHDKAGRQYSGGPGHAAGRAPRRHEATHGSSPNAEGTAFTPLQQDKPHQQDGDKNMESQKDGLDQFFQFYFLRFAGLRFPGLRFPGLRFPGCSNSHKHQFAFF